MLHTREGPQTKAGEPASLQTLAAHNPSSFPELKGTTVLAALLPDLQRSNTGYKQAISRLSKDSVHRR